MTQSGQAYDGDQIQVLEGLQQGAAGLGNLSGVMDKVDEALQPDIHNMFVGVLTLTLPKKQQVLPESKRLEIE